MTISADVQRKQNARRPKPQTACTSCKTKRLRCDRALPCTNCRRRPPGTCIYVPKIGKVDSRVSRIRSQNSQSQIDDCAERSKYPVLYIARTSNGNSAEVDHKRVLRDEHCKILPQINSHIDHQLSPGSIPELYDDDSETRLINPTGWESVLLDIDTSKSQIKSAQDSRDESPPTGELYSQPSLLFDNMKNTSIETLLISLPSKLVIDRIINLFTLGLDIPTHYMHLPTFLKEYKDFWEHPNKVALPWLPILYSVTSLTLQFVLKSGANVDGILCLETACRQYASKAAERLRSSDYTKPTSGVVEATLMYLLSEHMWLGQYPFRASLVLGFAIRLAMRSGYHRDPSYYRQISVFECETRRRIWSWLSQIDIIFASYVGIPRQIHHHQTDTIPPTAIPDEDLYPEMTCLPPWRSSEEPSAAGFLDIRAQLTMLLAQIMDYVASFQGLSYEKLLELDQALDELANSRSDWLVHLTPSGERIDETIRVNQALELDVLLQHARIVLHRRFCDLSRTNAKYSLSRERCVAAALQALHNRQTMSQVRFRVDGMTVNNWRELSMMFPIFLLGAMIVCFDVERDLRDESVCGTEPFEERLALLKSFQRSLAEGKNSNHGHEKVVHAIDVVVSRVDRVKLSYIDGNGFECISGSQDWFPSTVTPLSRPFGASTRHIITSPMDLFSDVSTTAIESSHGSSNFSQPLEILQDTIEGIPVEVDWKDWFL